MENPPMGLLPKRWVSGEELFLSCFLPPPTILASLLRRLGKLVPHYCRATLISWVRKFHGLNILSNKTLFSALMCFLSESTQLSIWEMKGEHSGITDTPLQPTFRFPHWQQRCIRPRDITICFQGHVCHSSQSSAVRWHPWSGSHRYLTPQAWPSL